MRRGAFLFLFLGGVLIWAAQATDMTQSHKQGEVTAKELLAQMKDAAKSTNLDSIPGFVTATPKEASLDASTIGNAVVMETQQNDSAKFMVETAQTHPTYVIDPKTDPLIVNGDRVMADPFKTLHENVVVEDKVFKSEDIIKTCEEGGSEWAQTCRKTLQVTLKIIPEIRETKRYCKGHWKNKTKTKKKYHKHGCKEKVIRYVPEEVVVEKEEWVDGCKILEDLADKGQCRYVDKKTSPKDETRMIQGKPITRDHFEETYTYVCGRPVQSTCAALRAQGCYQEKSTCKEHQGQGCAVWLHQYRCPGKTHQQHSYKTSSSSSPFCLTGNCADTSYEANGEMFEVLSQMTALKEAQGDLNLDGCIFKGQDKRCSKNCIDFKDCCGGEKGWGVSINFASCSGEEKELSEARKNDRCVYVGTYCSKKQLGICLTKKSSYCCFGSKISRLIHEQGRKQLGLSWGKAEKPNCRGFSPEELAKIDMSKIDFSELYEDIKNNFKPKSPSELSQSVNTDRIKKNMGQFSFSQRTQETK